MALCYNFTRVLNIMGFDASCMRRQGASVAPNRLWTATARLQIALQRFWCTHALVRTSSITTASLA